MPTIKDVAKRAGVAPGTVSRVLNNRDSISAKTREKVYAAMRELNYEPNELARSLQRQHSNLIAVIVTQIDHDYFSRMIQTFERVFADFGYRIIVYSSMQSVEQENILLPAIRSARIDGILICGSSPGDSVYATCEIPVVSVNRELSDDIPSVRCNEYLGGRIAADRLYRCGCHKVLTFVFPSLPSPIGLLSERTRFFGFVERAAELGLETVEYDNGPRFMALSPEEYRELYTRIMSQHPDIDGIFAESDVAAVGACTTLRELGYRIPDDIQVIGFDGIMLGSFLDITTIAQPVDAIAECAAEILIKKIRGKIVPTRSFLPVSLVEGSTTIKL